MIAFYITGHGFGHASREIEVINALIRHQADIRIVVRSSTPAWFLESSIRRPIEVHATETDTGIVQIDSLHFEEQATARESARFYDTFEARVSQEAAWLHSAGATLVLADVPPLACAAAARAGLPSIALANFTWDWIYQAMEGFNEHAPGVLDLIAQAYSTTTHALRLPLHGGFAPMADVVRDIPFIARRSRHSRASARAVLGIETERPVVLASFGGHQVRIPYDTIAADGRLTVLLTEFESGGVAGRPQLRSLTRAEMAVRHLKYEDLVAAADAVISKPGYGIVSECIANGTALLYTSRGRMIEYDVFVDQMPRMLRCRYIPQEDVRQGLWADAVEALLAQPEAPLSPMTNGAEVAAEFLLKAAS